jgi:hypothetical protein
MLNEIDNKYEVDMRWKDLYKIGGISCFIVSFLILLSIVAYFIWPYKAIDSSVSEIFNTINENVLIGLITLDLIMMIIMIINVIPTLAIYLSVKKINESFALIAVVLGLIGVAAVITARPLTEMAVLSNLYNEATNEASKESLLSAGEGFRVMFDGTAWMVQTVLFMIYGLIISFLMLKSKIYGKPVAIIGIVISVVGLFFFIPTVGLVLLFINTIGSIIWNILVGKSLIKIGQNNK